MTKTQHIAVDDSWDFRSADTKEFTHKIHAYPAMMIPQIARRILLNYPPQKSRRRPWLFDPFCGTGTTLLEGLIAGYNVIGTDLNPLAQLIAKVKTTIIDPATIRDEIVKFDSKAPKIRASDRDIPPITNIEFWFKPDVIESLAKIRNYIQGIENSQMRDFFWVTFSETVRQASLTKQDEFKLVRIKSEKQDSFLAKPIFIMKSKLERNWSSMVGLVNRMHGRKFPGKAFVSRFNTVTNIPHSIFPPDGVDIVITSPPYGDSSTTVAYGQYSRLSNQWIGFGEANQVDKALLGGLNSKQVHEFEIAPLDSAIKYIQHKNEKRAGTVYSFYYDLEKSCANVAKTVKRLGIVAYVVSNRRVQAMTLPTDVAIKGFFERCGLREIDRMGRGIPNKRMPLRNSPTNIPGLVESTMTRENIIILQKLRMRETH